MVNFPILLAGGKGAPLMLAKYASLGARSLPWLRFISTRLSSESTPQKYIKYFTKVIGGSVVIFSTAAFAHAVDVCPFTGRYRLSMTTGDEDIDIGDRMSTDLIDEKFGKQMILPPSHPLTRCVQRIADRLTRVAIETARTPVDASKSAHSMRIMIVSDSSENAIALPNGDIFVHAGLIGSVENEDELAGLIAHEIAHVLCRHSSEVVAVSDLARIPSGFLYSATMVSGDTIVSGLLRWIALRFTSPDRLLTEIPISRKLEAEADYLAVKYSCMAGYDLGRILDYWKRQQVRDNPHVWWSTHPGMETRLARMTMHVKDYAPQSVIRHGDSRGEFKPSTSTWWSYMWQQSHSPPLPQPNPLNIG